MAFEAKDIHDLATAIGDALGSKKEWVEVVKAAFWPAVVAIAIALFRRPFARMLEGFGSRVAKLSAFNVSIELASVTTRELAVHKIDIDVDELTQGIMTGSYFQILMARIRQDERPSFLVVDIGDGKRWLISRLLFFTFVLWRIGRVRCVVFVETGGEYRQRLLGVATPEKVCDALGSKYPWLDRALVAAWSDLQLPLLATPLSGVDAAKLVDRFPQSPSIQKKTPDGPKDDDVFNAPTGVTYGYDKGKEQWLARTQASVSPPTEKSEKWEELEGPGPKKTWEHTKWLTRPCVDEDLRGIFLSSDESQLVDTPDLRTGERNKALLRRKSPFVALVNERGELKQVVDRRVVMDALADGLRSEEKEEGR